MLKYRGRTPYDIFHLLEVNQNICFRSLDNRKVKTVNPEVKTTKDDPSFLPGGTFQAMEQGGETQT